MYHCKLNIVIFSKEALWEEIALGTVPLERFEHNITAYKVFSDEAFIGGDIIIVDLPTEESIGQLRHFCKKGAVFVYCAPADTLLELDEAELSAADECWQTPMSKALMTMRFKKLLSSIKRGRDYRLCETYLDAVMDTMPDIAWFKDKAGVHMKVNQAFCDVVGKSIEDVTGRDHCYIWNLDPNDMAGDEPNYIRSEKMVMEQSATCQLTKEIKSQHGMRRLRAYKAPLFDEDGAVMGTVGVGRDITDLGNCGAELEIFIRSMPFAILMWNKKGIITNANNKFEEYFDTSKQDVIGKHYGRWARNAFEGMVTVNGEGRAEAKSHTENPSRSLMLEIHTESIYDVFYNVVGHFCIYRDVTVERSMEAKIIKNSNTDFMTGLYNRRYLYQHLYANRKENTISVLSIDLDNFKTINDTYGHQVGDKALVLFSNILCKCFKGEVVARVGGDEFLVLIIGERSIEKLETMAQRLIGTMRGTFEDFPQLSNLSASIGIAQTDDPSFDMDPLIQQSDIALYTAKRRGKGQYVVYSRGM